MRRKGSLFYTISLFLSLLLAFQPETVLSQNSDEIQLQLKWRHQFQFAGYYAAQIKGYYSEANLKVELLEGSDTIDPISEVLKGTAQFGVSGSEILNHFIEDKPVVVIGTVFQHSPYVFLTMPGNKIHTPTDLAGKKVMVSEEQGWLMLKALFLREGIPVDSVKSLTHSWDINDLVAGKVDAISAYSTVEPMQFKRRGIKVNMIRPSDYGIDFYGDLLFTSRSITKQNPDMVERMVKASMKGWQYAMKHPEEIADYILSLPGVKERNISRVELLGEAAEMHKLILPDLVEIGHINEGRWENMLALYKQLGLAKSINTIDGLIYESPSEKKILYFDILLYALGIGISLIIIALFWNWQLRKLVAKRTTDLQNEISTRKRAEERLELSIQSAGLGIWDWDIDNKVVNYSGDWLSSLGYPPQYFVQNELKWLDIVHPDDQENVKEIINGLADGTSPSSNLAYRVKTADGSWRWILSFSKILAFNESGKAQKIIGTHLDIDFIKRKELELQEITNELRKKNSELEKFAYITSHNLRAPVVNLMSLTEMQNETSLPEELNTEITSKIHHCVQQLDSTLNDLIKIVASKPGEQSHREELNLKKELKSVIRSIEKQVTESGAKIEIDIPGHTEIYFPRQFLNSILLNLLTNALKYRSDDRRLKITVRSEERKDFILLHFSDNGLGIDMERFGSKIFGLYQRFHSNVEGKGLGLYIIKSQIEAMDGMIEVESKPNEGSTFKVYFRTKQSQNIL